MKRIVVTGGLGFIGSHTVVELQNEGFEVIIVDDLSNSSINVLEKIVSITGVRPNYETLDLKDQSAVKDFFKKYKNINGIIHFAASKAVGESVEKPLLYYHNNISSLIYLLEEMDVNNVHNFIFSSSCTVYGQADVMPITEEAPFKKAESPYGKTKQVGEGIISDTTKASQLNAIALRYFNPIGAHESAKIGELPIGVPQNLIPFVTQTAAGIREQLSVFGGDYPTVDGTAVRDYIHVVDLAQAHIIAMKRLLEDKNKTSFEVFNIGTGKGSTVLEVIQAFENVSKQKLNYQIVARREGDIIEAYADTTLANNELGWKAQLGLEEGLASSWKWQQGLVKK
jgi:UDP-glucose 4-epimerase